MPVDRRLVEEVARNAYTGDERHNARVDDALAHVLEQLGGRQYLGSVEGIGAVLVLDGNHVSILTASREGYRVQESYAVRGAVLTEGGPFAAPGSPESTYYLQLTVEGLPAFRMLGYSSDELRGLRQELGAFLAAHGS
jgi:hypothetical protein